MLKKRVASPTNAGSVSDSNDAGKGANLSDKTTWAPIVLFLGPCYAVKKVQFGRPVEHIDFRDVPRLYETVPLETAVHVWTNTAHEGTTRGLKQHTIYGVSMLERLFSEPCSEMRLCALYFSQQITKREFKDGMRALISDDFVFTSFQIALRRMRTDKKITKMSPTLQVFIPDAQSEVRAESTTRLKWAIKYNPEVISFDEGNLLVDQYDVQEALGFACKYGRKVRIARWGEEIADVPLCDLLYLSMVDFLHTGRYIDCEYVARAHAYSEARHRNGLGLVATHEDFAFDYGYVLDKEGHITKFRKPSSTPTAKKFSVADLFRPKKSPTNTTESGIPGSPKPRNSFLRVGSMRSRKGELSEEHKLIERQIQLELGVEQPVVSERAVRFSEGTDNENGSDGEEWAETAAAAARNANKKRTETNWVVFLNHKIPSSAAPLPSSSKGKSRLSSRRGSFLTTGAADSELPVTPTGVATPTSPQHDLQAELGSYSYGLSDKKPYKPAQSNAADAAATRVVWKEPATAEVSPAKLSEANLVRNHSLRMRELEEFEQRTLAAQMQAQAEADAQAQAQAEAQAQIKNLEAIQALVLAAAQEPNTETAPAQRAITTTFTRLEPEQEESPRRAKASIKKVVIVEPEIPIAAPIVAPAVAPEPLPAPTRSESTRPPRAALSIRIPSDTSMVSARTETPVDAPPSATFTTTDNAKVGVKVEALPPVEVEAPRTSPKFSPRARLVPSASDEALAQRVLSEENANTRTTDSANSTTDEAADEAVVTVLQKASVFKAVDVQQLHSPTSSSVTTPGTTSYTTSVAPVVKVHRIATPTAMNISRPVPRGPSSMEVRKAPEPAVKESFVPVRPAAPEESQEAPSLHPETAHPPSAPEVVPVTVEPVTVREKKEVIEVRIRSQRVGSGRTEPIVGTGATEPSKPLLTQKKLQQKWAFNTVMRNQAVHN